MEDEGKVKDSLHQGIEILPHSEALTDRETDDRGAPTKQWWIIEIWKEKREVFKVLVEHILFFLFLIGALLLFHHIIKISDLSDPRKEILETIDFYGVASALVIFTLSFIIKLLVLTFWSSLHDKK